MVPRAGRRCAGISLLCLASAGVAARAIIEIPAAVAAALADARRPAKQMRLDAARTPAQVIAFAGIKAGDYVVDFMPGNAYFTRLFSDVVGRNGHVYAFLPTEQVKNCAPREIAGTYAIARRSVYANVTVLSEAVGNFRAPKKT